MRKFNYLLILLSFLVSVVFVPYFFKPSVVRAQECEDYGGAPCSLCGGDNCSLCWCGYYWEVSCGGCDGGGACFTGDTPVRMADDSEKPIEEVEVGEMVKSFDSETGEITESEVTKVYEHSKEEVKGYYILTTESGRQVKVTPEHPILAEKTSETMSPLQLATLKLKAMIFKLLGKI